MNKINDKYFMPVDRGWAWIVVIASFMALLLSLGVKYVKGMILVMTEETFNCSPSELSLIITLEALTSCIGSLLILGMLSQVINLRIVIMCGGILFTLAHAVAYTANSIGYMYGYALIFGVMAATSGSYATSFNLLGSMIIISAVFIKFVTLPLLSRKKGKRLCGNKRNQTLDISDDIA